MKEDLLRKRNVVPIGSREWRELQRASQQAIGSRGGPEEPDWPNMLVAKPEVTDKLPLAVRHFLREIGRRGGYERSRNYARRNVRKGVQFWRRHGCNPHQVKARPVKASPEQRRHLLTYASRGGRARAANHGHEELAAIAAKGGRAKAEKAAKLKQPALCASAIAAKQPKG